MGHLKFKKEYLPEKVRGPVLGRIYATFVFLTLPILYVAFTFWDNKETMWDEAKMLLKCIFTRWEDD